MILQALAQYYDALAAQGLAPRPGWSVAKVSFALNLDARGRLIGVIPLKREVQRGNKTAQVPSAIQVPEQVKKTSGIAANFLCDGAAYLLGAGEGDKAARALECFAASRELHQNVLSGVDSPAARAVLAYFDSWQPERARECAALADCWKELAGAGLVFWFEQGMAQEDAAVRRAWEAYRRRPDPEAVPARCLVTGEYGPIARLHPAIKGVRDAQSSGASLVSYNAPAFESYGKEQGQNAPVGEAAAFAYGAALNALLADQRHVQLVGDATVVFWAQSAEVLYQDLFNAMAFGADDEAALSDGDLRDIAAHVARGEAVRLEGIRIAPEEPFCVLGLSPNAARLSVRFFLRNSFGNLLKNLDEHNRRLEIVRPAYERDAPLGVWRLLQETVNQKSRDKKPAPLLAGAFLRAILSGGDYPAALLQGVMLRIRAEQSVTYGRAAILKAYWLKRNSHHKEVLTVALNEETNCLPYVLGRMFSVLEAVQQAANPGINATIKDRFFNSACATPAVVFPRLWTLSQNHLAKLEDGLSIYYQKQIGGLMNKIEMGAAGRPLPAHLSLEDQGAFILGYYHQTQKRYEKKQKEEPSHV